MNLPGVAYFYLAPNTAFTVLRAIYSPATTSTASVVPVPNNNVVIG